MYCRFYLDLDDFVLGKEIRYVDCAGRVQS